MSKGVQLWTSLLRTRSLYRMDDQTPPCWPKIIFRKDKNWVSGKYGQGVKTFSSETVVCWLSAVYGTVWWYLISNWFRGAPLDIQIQGSWKLEVFWKRKNHPLIWGGKNAPQPLWSFANFQNRGWGQCCQLKNCQTAAQAPPKPRRKGLK